MRWDNTIRTDRGTIVKRKTFEECIEKNTLIKITVEKNKILARHLLSLAEHRQNFWKSVSQKTKEYPSLFLEGYYKIIKELSTAILALDGWTSLDHECLFAYLKHERQELEVDFDYLFDLKDIRNEISYRGLEVSHETWENNELKLQLTIDAMKEYLTSKLQQ